MKTKFYLDAHKAELSGSVIEIVGQRPKSKPYVRIEIAARGSDLAKQCMFIEDKDLERFAVNILKALKSNKISR